MLILNRFFSSVAKISNAWIRIQTQRLNPFRRVAGDNFLFSVPALGKFLLQFLLLEINPSLLRVLNFSELDHKGYKNPQFYAYFKNVLGKFLLQFRLLEINPLFLRVLNFSEIGHYGHENFIILCFFKNVHLPRLLNTN